MLSARHFKFKLFLLFAPPFIDSSLTLKTLSERFEHWTMWGAYGRSVEHSAVTFVSHAANRENIRQTLGLAKNLLPVENTRNIGKKDLKLNDACPHVEVHPETYEVRADGELLTCQPAEVLPMAQRYFLF